MSIPNTTGIERTNLASMQVGDYISFNYDTTGTGVVGVVSNLGTATGTEIPVTGIAIPNVTNGDKAYFLKSNKGFLICDRNLQTGIAWDVLNAGEFIEGKIVVLNSINALIRSLSGGCAFIDTNGNSSIADISLGAFPSINEWEKYVVNNDLGGKITKGSDTVWNWSSLYSWCKETPILSIGTNTNRVYRGKDMVNTFSKIISSTISATIGFRPCLEFLEVGSKASTLFY